MNSKFTRVITLFFAFSFISVKAAPIGDSVATIAERAQCGARMGLSCLRSLEEESSDTVDIVSPGPQAEPEPAVVEPVDVTKRAQCGARMGLSCLRSLEEESSDIVEIVTAEPLAEPEPALEPVDVTKRAQCGARMGISCLRSLEEDSSDIVSAEPRLAVEPEVTKRAQCGARMGLSCLSDGKFEENVEENTVSESEPVVEQKASKEPNSDSDEVAKRAQCGARMGLSCL